MTTITLSSHRQFDVDETETILDGALRCGIVLEHSCRTGRCGACKSQVVSGETRAIIAETGLTADERGNGAILTCARSAMSDVTLSVFDLGDVALPPRRIVPCRISVAERLSDDVMRVVLRMPSSTDFSFLPGQYIDVAAKNGVRRSYSVANASRPDGTIDLHVRRVEGGAMSRYWFEDAAVNDLLRLSGPLGTFFLRDPDVESLIFLATGTGIAPIKAMLEDLARTSEAGRPRRIEVFWGGRHPADLYWDPTSLGTFFDYTPVLSRADDNWAGARGYVQDALLAAGIPIEAAVVYACGSSTMIEAAREALIGAGLDQRKFYSDAFVAST